MAAESIDIEIVTPEEAVFRGTASEVVIPGATGEIGVLPGHLPLLTSIIAGDLKIVGEGGVRHFFIEGGFAEILPNKVSVLTELCQGFEELDVTAARQALEAAERELVELEERAKAEEVEADVRERHQEALERARRRLLFAEEE